MTAWIIFLLISIILYSFLKYWAIIPISSILLGIGLGYLANFRRPEKPNLLNNQFNSLILLDLAAKHQLKLGKLSANDYQNLKYEIYKFYLTLCEELEKRYSLQQHKNELKTELIKPIQASIQKTPVEIIEKPKKPKKPEKPRWNLLNILMPFIWQNIGWFIGGFCFVSGSIFLVSYTSGFYNALTIFLVLSLYSFGLFWGAYQIRQHRQELVTSSSVLFTLGILLVPLNFTAALRLINSGMENGILLSFAILLSILAVSIFFIATRIAAGIMERSLQKEYPPLFIALAALQFTKPFILQNSLVLISLYLILLTILGYALRRFTQHWLHSIFIDKHKTAYYTAGTLLYAAIVSFVLLTWNSGINLPNGYAGFFLMAICLLLLSVDVQFKQWVNKQALLSYFSFVIYALSILAILFSLPTFSILTLVLGMGAILYGLMVWQYLTVQPLYLFLASLSGLYWIFILQYFPLHWYFLLSLPGIGGIMLLHSFAEKRESAQLALVCCRVVMALATVLLVSSLYYAPPGEIALLTALIATIGILRNLYKPSRICTTDEKLKPFEPYKGYIATALATLTLAYMPLYFGTTFIHQFTIGLIILAILWATWGLLQSKNTDFIITTEVLFNSGLLSLILSIILATLYTQEFLVWILIIVSSVLLWLSLKLRIRLLFYAMLLTLAAAGGLLKYYYFPTSSGRGLILLSLGVWLLLWWFHYRLVYLSLNSPKTEKSEKTETLSYTILWFFKVSQKSSIFKMLKLPLQQTMILLWLIGIWRIIEPVFLGNPTILNTSWGISAFWAALLTAFIAGYTRILALLPVTLFLLLGTLFVINPLTENWFPFIAATYALILWFFSLFLPKLPLTKLLAFFDWQGNYGSKGGRVQTEHWIYKSTFIIILLSIATALFSQTQVLLSVLGITSIFFWKSGLNYRIRLNIYLFIISISLAGLIIIMQVFPLVSEESLFFILSSAIIWANLLLILSWLTKRHLNYFSNPLFVFSFLLLGILLLGGINLFSIAIWFMKDNIWEMFVIFALLLNLSFLHVLILRPQSLAAHSLIFSLFLTILLLFLTLLGMPLLLNIWMMALLLFIYFTKNTNNSPIKEINQAIQKNWLPISFIAGLTSLALDIGTTERLINLGLLSGLTFIFGFQNKRQKQARGWMVGGVILLWVILHSLWIIWQPEAEFSSLLPWYALQNAIIAATIILFNTKNQELNWLINKTSFWLTTIAASAWLLHGIHFFTNIETNYLFGSFAHIATLLTGILLILLWWRNALTESRLIYGIAIIIGLLIIYSRLLWLGLAPLNVWDTAILMSLGYILFSFHQFAPSKPLYSLTLLLPLLAILTIPLQLDSIYATTTLIAAATLYLLITPNSENKLPMYLGLLALNIGIYVWIPGWAENYKLIQVYTIPVAITVLIMLQFHKLELKPSVVNTIRLTALSAIYATATLDVFMRPELGIFILALSLSLGGIILGIALRIRAFLYLGTLFLIFNVFGQLIDFYPEERLSKAIVLMVLGGIITGGMIWFNMQREVLMQRIRIIRADLARWE